MDVTMRKQIMTPGDWEIIHSVENDTVLQNQNFTKYSFTVDNQTVQYQYFMLKVTAIEKNAFKNNKKINKVTIGKNVKTIGANEKVVNTIEIR